MNKLMKSPKNLILYKDFENGKLFYNMTWIMENYENEYYNKEDVESLLYESLNQLMELAVSHGFEGNLWHSFLAFILVNNENAYSKACEIPEKWRALSIRSYCMTLRSSNRCLISILESLPLILRWTVSMLSPITRA